MTEFTVESGASDHVSTPVYSEALHIPASVRATVDERDGRMCRLCGQHAGVGREIHHLLFGGARRGIGGRRQHNPDEMVSLCRRCHMRAHQEKSVWIRWLLLALEHDGTTALQQRRWAQAKGGRAD